MKKVGAGNQHAWRGGSRLAVKGPCEDDSGGGQKKREKGMKGKRGRKKRVNLIRPIVPRN